MGSWGTPQAKARRLAVMLGDRIPVDGTSAGRGSISRPLHRWSYENLLRQSLLAAAVDVGGNPRG